jgi:hypothetical protein
MAEKVLEPPGIQNQTYKDTQNSGLLNLFAPF